ncbi:TetR/AcrR family transcriptional regulator [Angustibacter aerolatus]
MPRATPLSPDERRRHLVDATLPLLVQHGRAVSTRQIARAAGVAEGTIFRVFDSKDELLEAAVARALDPELLVRDLQAVDVDQPLEARLVEVVQVMQERLQHVWALMLAMGRDRPPDAERLRGGAARPKLVGSGPALDAVRALVEPDRDALRVEVDELVRRLRVLTFAGTHPLITDGQPMTADEIVSTLLDGLRTRGDA